MFAKKAKGASILEEPLSDQRILRLNLGYDSNEAAHRTIKKKSKEKLQKKPR